MKNTSSRITITKLVGFPFYCFAKSLYYLGPLTGWGTVFIWLKRGKYRCKWDNGEGWPTTGLWYISLFLFPVFTLSALIALCAEWSINGKVMNLPVAFRFWSYNEITAFVSYYIIKAWLVWSKDYDQKFFNKEDTF